MENDEIIKKSIFKNKNFLLLFQGALTSSIASIFYSFAISFYILDITSNNASIQGIYLFVCGLVYVLFSFIGGVLADRWNKVKIIYGSDFIKGILILISLILLKYFIDNDMMVAQIAVLFVIGIVNNILGAIFIPASTALLPEIVDSDQLMQANSLFSIQNNILAILGIVLAAVFYSIFSIKIIFLIVGILYVVSGITELFIHSIHIKKEGTLTLKIIFKDFADGLKYLWGLKPIFFIIISALFVNFFTAPFLSNLLPYIIKTDITGSNYILKNIINPESWAAVVSLVMGIGSIIMSIIMGSKNSNNKFGTKIKFYLMFSSVILIGLAISYVFAIKININIFLISLIVCSFILGISMVGINLPLNVAIQKNVEKGMLAKVDSIMAIGAQGLTPFASLIAGFILSTLNSIYLFFFCAIGLVIVAIIMSFSKNISKI